MSGFKRVKVLGGAVFMAAIIIICASCTNSMFIDSRDITSGEIEGFSIGMTKKDIFLIAQQKHVHAIRPLLNPSLYFDYSNFDALAPIGNGRSIELDDMHNLKVIYTITNCKVSAIKVLGLVSAPPSISIGDSCDSLFANLKKIVTDNHSSRVHEVISSHNESWFVIDSQQKDNAYLVNSYDVWSFEVSTIKPAGAEFVIYFSEGVAVRISYKRPRIRLE
ncbi:hypothetical protein [Rhodanobacter hydrolyticus]|uniref:Lipoprotein n=1 Tax=Rhodanobacter hydrolyticus TaxID=2250595 RepID=A0ABW8J874_9GAMM